MQFKKLVKVLIPLCLLGLIVTFIPSAFAQALWSEKRFEVALIGDLPYDTRQEAKFQELIQDINKSSVRFVIHDGDFKSGSSLCSDELFTERLQDFQKFKQPLIYTPGDNEWTDCHRPAAGGYDSIERLAKLRELSTQGERSFGQTTIALTRQSENPKYNKFRENVRWESGNVLFVGLHVVGSNNNLGRNPENDAEYAERNAANLAWLEEAFALAKADGNLGLAFFMQANPNFDLAPTNTERTGFNDLINALQAELKNYSKQVILIHGDSHYFRIDKPLNTSDGTVITNFTRIETFGSPNVHWLRLTVNPRNPNLFEVNQEILP